MIWVHGDGQFALPRPPDLPMSFLARPPPDHNDRSARASCLSTHSGDRSEGGGQPTHANEDADRDERATYDFEGKADAVVFWFVAELWATGFSIPSRLPEICGKPQATKTDLYLCPDRKSDFEAGV